MGEIKFLNKIRVDDSEYSLNLYSNNMKNFSGFGPYIQVSEVYPINNNENAVFCIDRYNQLMISLSFYIEPGIPKNDSNVLCTMAPPFNPYPSKMLFSDITGKNNILLWTTDAKTIYFDNLNTQNYDNGSRHHYIIHFILYRKSYI